MDEKKILAALKKGDGIAFGALFNRYAPAIFHFSLDLTKNEDDAEEILQETFVRLWEYRNNIDVERNVKNYIISIAKNLIYNAIKRRMIESRYLSKTSSGSDSYEMERELHRRDLRNILFGCFNRLTPHQKKILRFKTDGLDNDEIASLLDVSQRTIESHITRAYKRLRVDLNCIKDIFQIFIPLIIYSF